ncbi:MAG: SAM-dependent methyltransferase [Candidatus Kuenenbacteria bacterium]
MNYLSLIGLAIIGILLFSVALATISLAPWVPTRKRDLKRIFELTGLKPGQIFYDLGCGTGGVVFYGARKYKLRTRGIELGLPLYIVCVLKKIFSGTKRTEFIWGNFFKTDFSDADAVYLFGIPMSLKSKLKERLKKELRPGTKVVSYVFPIKGWQAVKVDEGGKEQVNIYLYEI